MAKKVGEFFIELAVDAASGNLSVKQLVSSLGELDVVSVGSAGLMAKVAEALYGMARAATDTAVELTALQELTGDDPKIVQQWDKAAERVTHSSGAIVRAIKAVHDMNVGLSVGKSPPAELTGILGLSPYKSDGKGGSTTKDALEYLKELASPGSVYRSRSRDVQQQGLNALFPGAGAEMFRVVNSMIAGTFHPEMIKGLNDRQVKDLNRVDTDRIKIGQQFTDIFQHLLISGGGVADAMDKVIASLQKFDEWLESKTGKRAVQNAEAGVGAFFHARNYNPFMVGEDFGKSMGKLFLGDHAAPRPRIQEGPLELKNLRGQLDINLLRDGSPIGTRKAFVDQTPGNREFWSVTDTLGNTP